MNEHCATVFIMLKFKKNDHFIYYIYTYIQYLLFEGKMHKSSGIVFNFFFTTQFFCLQLGKNNFTITTALVFLNSK